MTPEPKCPFCDTRITTWTVIKAPMPWAVRCQACGNKISVRDTGLFFAGYLAAVIIVASLLIIAHRRSWISSGMAIVVALILVLALEIMTSAIVLRRAKFVKPGT